MQFIVIGPGRAGSSFASALADRGWCCVAVLGRSDDIAGAAAEVDLVLLTVPDDRIAEVAAGIAPGAGVVAHTSGAKGLDVLAPHRRRASLHPLVSLPDPVTGARRLVEGGVFAVAGEGESRAVVDAAVTALGGRPVDVGDDVRALYHATAAVAANHLVALCGQVERLASQAGVPVDAYWALMATTLENVRKVGPLASLTGPAARGDASTIALHLEALPTDERTLYLALANEAARLAGRPGY